MNWNFIKEKKKEILITIVILSIIIFSLILNSINFTKEKIEGEKISQEQLEKYEEKLENEKKIFIHLDGAIKKKGLIELSEGDRLEKAITKAGGLLDSADLKYVNLAMILSDGEKIYIPNKNEIVDYSSGISYLPDLQESRKVNINRGNLEELQKIPGVGPSTAQNIMNYRKKNGNFKKLEDLKKVSGIGDSKFNSMLEYISI